VPSCDITIKDRLCWLAGLIDSDGTLQSKEGSISISSINREFLIKIKLMLNTLSINTTVSIMHKETIRNLPDGKDGKKEYHTKTSYRLLISSYNISELMKIGLKTYRVPLQSNPNRNASRFIKITNITENIKLADKVYCFNEPIKHSGIFNGIITAQCAEEPLPEGGSCLLGSINLSEFIINNNFNVLEFEDTVKKCVIGLNEVLDEGLPFHPLKEQRESVSK
jgi:ribonucleoside-diphosphate reductase alpha chain